MKKRNTVQRVLILEAAKELLCHSTADEIYEYIVKKHPTISRGTVYRNLNSLSETGEILKVEIPDGADRYDHQCHNHYHARCIKCGQVFDAEMHYIDGLEKRINDTQGFNYQSHDIVFKGVCLECNKKNERDD